MVGRAESDGSYRFCFRHDCSRGPMRKDRGFWGFSILKLGKYYRAESPSIVESPSFSVSWNPRWGIGILPGGSWGAWRSACVASWVYRGFSTIDIRDSAPGSASTAAFPQLRSTHKATARRVGVAGSEAARTFSRWLVSPGAERVGMSKVAPVTRCHYYSITNRHRINQAIPKRLGLSLDFGRMPKPSPGPCGICVPRQHQRIVETKELVEFRTDLRPARSTARRFRAFLDFRNDGNWQEPFWFRRKPSFHTFGSGECF